MATRRRRGRRRPTPRVGDRPRVLFGMTSGLSAPGFLRGQGPFLVDRGWQATLLCSDEAGVRGFAERERLDFFPVELKRTSAIRAVLRGWWQVSRAVTDVDPDIAVWGSPVASLLGVTACRLHRVPSVYVLHGLRLEGASGRSRALLWLAERVTCRLAGTVVADGFELRDSAIGLRVVSPHRVDVLAHGSANGVSPARRPPRYRAALGIQPTAQLVAYVGRLTEDKGIAELAAAWAQVAHRHPQAHLVLAGRVDPADPRAGDLAAAFGRLPRVHLLGHVEDLEALWPETDLLVLPSRREGLPLVVLEAAAAGVPAVVTRCTGGPEVVADDRTGVLVAVRVVAGLADAVTRLLSDDETRRAFGIAAQSRALTRYDRPALWGAMADLLAAQARRAPTGTATHS